MIVSPGLGIVDWFRAILNKAQEVTIQATSGCRCTLPARCPMAAPLRLFIQLSDRSSESGRKNGAGADLSNWPDMGTNQFCSVKVDDLVGLPIPNGHDLPIPNVFWCSCSYPNGYFTRGLMFTVSRAVNGVRDSSPRVCWLNPNFCSWNFVFFLEIEVEFGLMKSMKSIHHNKHHGPTGLGAPSCPPASWVFGRCASLTCRKTTIRRAIKKIMVYYWVGHLSQKVFFLILMIINIVQKKI